MNGAIVNDIEMQPSVSVLSNNRFPPFCGFPLFAWRLNYMAVRHNYEIEYNEW